MTNQNKMDDKFKKTMQKILVAFIITLAVIIVGAFIYIYIRSPKTTNLADSTLFTEEEVYSKSEEIIGLFESGDNDGLRALCNTEMAGRMTDEVLKNGMDGFGGSLGDSYGFELPDNLYEWKATCHHNHRLLELGEQFCSLTKKQYLYMMYVWGHSYEFGRDNNWAIMEKFCEMTGHRDDIWYATNIEYVSYMEAAKRLVYAYDLSFVYNPSAMSVWICVNNDNYIEVKGGTQVDLSMYL